MDSNARGFSSSGFQVIITTMGIRWTKCVVCLAYTDPKSSRFAPPETYPFPEVLRTTPVEVLADQVLSTGIRRSHRDRTALVSRGSVHCNARSLTYIGYGIKPSSISTLLPHPASLPNARPLNTAMPVASPVYRRLASALRMAIIEAVGMPIGIPEQVGRYHSSKMRSGHFAVDSYVRCASTWPWARLWQLPRQVGALVPRANQ